MANTTLERNLAALAETQPRMAQLVKSSERTKSIKIETSKSGDLVPTFSGQGYHSLNDTIVDEERMIRNLLQGCVQERILLIGFGFGYQARALCRLGFSPMVYEPDLGLARLAFEHVDLTDVIPFTTFYFGSVIPTVPPRTKLLVHPFTNEAYPMDLHRLRQTMGEEPPHTNDVTEGEKCETYRNVPCLKNPYFLVCYHMLFSLVRPNILIEVGTCRGGAALLYSDLLNRMGGRRHVYTIDVVDNPAPEVNEQPNLTFYPHGHASFDLSVIRPSDRVMVIEDSSHTYENTAAVLARYSDVVTPNSYLIVEDTATDHPMYNGGPMRAVKEFLAKDSRFERDLRWEHFFGTEWEGHCVFLRRKI